MSSSRKKESTSRSAAKSLKQNSAIAKLTKLGDKPTALPAKSLEVFPNPQSRRDFLIHMQIPEFTCLCPKTGQPDFATLYLDYIPDRACVELKSLKLYLWSFRNDGIFYERAVNRILDDLVAACRPKHIKVVGDFNVRGGLKSIITAQWTRP